MTHVRIDDYLRIQISLKTFMANLKCAKLLRPILLLYYLVRSQFIEWAVHIFHYYLAPDLLYFGIHMLGGYEPHLQITYITES